MRAARRVPCWPAGSCLPWCSSALDPSNTSSSDETAGVKWVGVGGAAALVGLIVAVVAGLLWAHRRRKRRRAEMRERAVADKSAADIGLDSIRFRNGSAVPSAVEPGASGGMDAGAFGLPDDISGLERVASSTALVPEAERPRLHLAGADGDVSEQGVAPDTDAEADPGLLVTGEEESFTTTTHAGEPVDGDAEGQIVGRARPEPHAEDWADGADAW